MKTSTTLVGVFLSLFLSGIVQAGTVTFQTSAPTPGPLDVFSFTVGATDADNVFGGDDAGTYVAFDRGAQGQTFMSGGATEGYQLDAIWLQWVSYDNTYVYLPPGGEFHARVTDPAAAGGAGFVLHTDTFTTTGSEPDTLPTVFTGPTTGDGTWLRFELASPVVLAANGLYGFDVSSPGPAAGFGGFDVQPFFETAGTSTDAFASGEAYTSGPNGSGGDDTLTARGGDRAFLLELTLVPEPTTFALGGFGLLGMLLARRRS